MAAPSGTVDLDVAQLMAQQALELQLRQRPFCFEFFQAVRVLERLDRQREPVGRFPGDPADEVVRFGAHASAAFPASEIQSLEWKEGQAPRMTVNFMGMTGPQGVLPLHYTMLLIEQLRGRETGLVDFLDIFNHRILSLFYRAWEKYRFTVAYERGEQKGLPQHVMALLGLGTPGLQDRQDVSDDSLMYYAGLLSQRPRSATALRQLLSDYFDVPVEIEQFAGAWYRLDADTQCCMEEGDSPSEQLGGGAVVGDEVWAQQSRVRIKLGPLTLPQYLDFLPDGTANKPLRALVRFFTNDEFDCEAQLVLKRDEVPRCELAAEGEAAPRLGWVTWVKRVPLERDPGETILQL
jgi:type VI secretion system protein ImpH